MKKKDFLEKLRWELRGLAAQDVEEIIRDQEEFIRDAMSSGRSEEEVVDSLGSPKTFADSVKLEYKVNKINNSSSTWESYQEILGTTGILLALAPVNIILIFIIGFPVLSFLFGWVTTCVTIAFVGLFLLFIPLIGLLVSGFSLLQASALGFLSLGFVFLGLAGLGLFYLFAKAFIRVFTAYANWNIEMIKGRI